MVEVMASNEPMAINSSRCRALSLVWLVILGVSVVLATPAAACSCSEPEVSREEVLRRGGGIDGTVTSVSEPYQRTEVSNEGDWLVDVDIAVSRAYGADPGHQLVLPAIPGGSVDLGDGTSVASSCGIDLQSGNQISVFLDEEVLSSCSPVTSGFDATLADPPPPPTAQPVRFLGAPAEPGKSLAGLSQDGAYVSQVALPAAGQLIRCPGDLAAIVQHGPAAFTGVEDISWSRLDLTTLAVEELIDIATLNPDPTRLQNVAAGTVCLTHDASDVLALFSWWEQPDVKPQRLIRITGGVVREVVIAPIWQIWAHDGTIYARVGDAGTDIVTLDPDTGDTVAHGTLPVGGLLQVAADGTWGLLTAFDTSTSPHSVQRVQLVPGVTVTATTTVTDRFAQPLADGRTMVTLPPSAGGPLLEVLDETLRPEGAWPVEGAGTGLGVLATDPHGAWLVDRDGQLSRLDRGAAPIPTNIHADLVLPFSVVPNEALLLEPIQVVTYDQPSVSAPTPTALTQSHPGPDSPAATASTAAQATGSPSWLGITAGLLALAIAASSWNAGRHRG